MSNTSASASGVTKSLLPSYVLDTLQVGMMNGFENSKLDLSNTFVLIIDFLLLSVKINIKRIEAWMMIWFVSYANGLLS